MNPMAHVATSPETVALIAAVAPAAGASLFFGAGVGSTRDGHIIRAQVWGRGEPGWDRHSNGATSGQKDSSNSSALQIKERRRG